MNAPDSSVDFVVTGKPPSASPENAAKRQRLEQWRAEVRTEAQRANPPTNDLVTGEVRVRVDYFSAVMTQGDRPDVDGILKPIRDAMGGIVYEDDRQVVDLCARKRNTLSEVGSVHLPPAVQEHLGQHVGALDKLGDFVHVQVSPHAGELGYS